MLPQQATEETCRLKIGLDIEQVKEDHENPQPKVGKPVFEWIVFLLFLLSWA